MDIDKELELVLEEMYTDDREARALAWQKLLRMGNGDPQFFIELLNLEQRHSLVRNNAAYELRRIGDARAFEPLLNYILNPKNIHYNGSMVYALAVFDCSQHLKEIFQILFYHGDEAKMSAQSILSDQEFDFYESDLYEIKAMWEACKEDHSLCPNFDDWHRSIEANVNGFLSYLDQ